MSRKAAIRDLLNGIEQQIKKEKRYKKYEKKSKNNSFDIEVARMIIDASQQHKLLNIVKIWNESDIRQDLELEIDDIYETAINKQYISGRNFTKFSLWVRFCLFVEDKGRASVYNFSNEQFVSRIPMYYPEGYYEFKKLPAGYNPYVRPNEETEPTNYVIRLSGNQTGIKQNEANNIIITRSIGKLCAQYRELKRDILRLKTKKNDNFFVNHNNKPLTRIQNTKNSLLHKVEIATGIDDVTTNTFRKYVEAIIQSNEEMTAICKNLNSHTAQVGKDNYDKSGPLNKAEFVNCTGNYFLLLHLKLQKIYLKYKNHNKYYKYISISVIKCYLGYLIFKLCVLTLPWTGSKITYFRRGGYIVPPPY